MIKTDKKKRVPAKLHKVYRRFYKTKHSGEVQFQSCNIISPFNEAIDVRIQILADKVIDIYPEVDYHSFLRYLNKFIASNIGIDHKDYGETRLQRMVDTTRRNKGKKDVPF